MSERLTDCASCSLSSNHSSSCPTSHHVLALFLQIEFSEPFLPIYHSKSEPFCNGGAKSVISMKVTVERAPQNPPPSEDTLQKPPLRKEKATVRLKREFRCLSSRRSSRPETPSLRWNLNKGNGENNSTSAAEEEKPSREGGRRTLRGIPPTVSARKLAARMWHLRPPEFPSEKLGHLQFPDMAMEGKTKWDPNCCKPSDEMNHQMLSLTKPLHRDHQAIATKILSGLESELEEARRRIDELETERRHSKKTIKQFLLKLGEERAVWRSRELEKIRAVMDDAKASLSQERKNHQRLEMINSKLIDQLADVKLVAKRYLQEYEKERKVREMVEEVCGELVKEIGDGRLEMEALKRKSRELLEEVEEERRMLQVAEVWREERVQMKLVDAKVMLEEKYCQMNRLVEDLESFLKSGQVTSDMEEIKKMESLRQMTGLVNIEDVRELAYEPTNPDDIFSVFEDVNFGESREREVESCGRDAKMINKDGTDGRPDLCMDQKCELEEDASEWETVSRCDDEGSSYSSSDPSVSNTFQASSVSLTGKDGEKEGGQEMAVREINEIKLVKQKELKKVPSVSRRTPDDKNRKLSNGRPFNCPVAQDLDRQSSSSSLDSGNPHMPWALKGCIEWPCSAQKSSSKARLMEASADCQKIQLRHVLKQKI